MSNLDKEIVLKYVDLIKSKMDTDEMKFLKQFHPTEYEEKLDNFVPEFRKEYPFLYKLIINDSDLSNLYVFLNTIDNIKNGKISKEDATAKLGVMLDEQFVPKKLKK